ncbi:MAG: hypothetical protein BAA01_05765 [Bacillus thermozeamaize]|uniref:Dynamin N-terminal domain-containing protein n=1 Tax=Bacillus thermozeamaize TaxID=230954 RepID=A0A1Y3PBE4_9BACI|nr:MAG: hypothetical protein BAA01_05765 [Bacillus thermozeamaize]
MQKTETARERETGELASWEGWRRSLQELAGEVERAGDAETAAKLRELAEKAANPGLRIAFCGHFSAGKSTLVNRLLGCQVLPSSPIPTSANVVYLSYGDWQMNVHLRSGGQQVYRGREEVALGQEVLKDSELAQNVYISVPAPCLSEGLVFMDTPGVDSNDAAHQLATESALHLADVVVYVMDYNHVQSEVNLHFLRQLQAQDKPIVVVVNQIDKHLEWELSFAAFRQGVDKVLDNWGIQPTAVFYTSMKEIDHPENTWDSFCVLLERLAGLWGEIRPGSMLAAARHLLAKHLERMRRQQEEERQRWHAVLEQEEQADEKLARREELEGRRQQLLQMPAAFQEAAERELQQLLTHAPLAPYEIRQLGKTYLEARFKRLQAGRWRQKRAIRAEQEALDAFAEALRHQVEAQLEWHLKRLLIELPGEYGLKSGEWEQKVYGLQVEWTPELLQEQVKAGAVAGETYVLQYMEDVAQSLKRLWRQAALPMIEEARQEIERALTPQREDVAQELARTAELAEAREAIRALDEALSMHEKTLRDRLPGDADWQHVRGAMQRLLEEVVAELLASRANPALNREDAAIRKGSAIQGPAVSKSGPSIARLPGLGTLPTGAVQRDVPVAGVAAVAPESRRLQEMAKLLRKGAELLGDLPPFAAWSATLRERAERLAARRFTVALFGAFSAGKSSFANALLGEPLLPVSPNPTTAAINLIQASEEGHPHGTAGIQMKTPADMVRDVTGAFRACGFHLEEEALAGKTAEEQEAVLREGLAALEQKQAPPDGELYLSFIRAAIRGWAEMAPLLGQSLEVDVSEFQNMVADETKACFVERVTLYYDCPLTVQGIALVDTPGADSVHARHTGVAFQFLKDADAVLYLTYYNHAFSKADREFLLQMGRVKSAFELDKMFFLLNAADLASSSEELLQVMEHLRHELGALGISRPNLFPVSSQLALLAVRRAHLQRAAAASGSGLVEWPESLQLRYRQLMERVRPLQDILTRDISAGAVSSPVSDEAWRCSGIQQFEQAFYHFIFHQLADLALQNARAELLRGLEQLEQMIQWAQSDNQARASRAAEVQHVWQELLSAIEGLDAQAVFVAAENELQELLYYVRQRLFLRMPDFFQDAFSAIGEGSRPVREHLAQALESMLRQTAMDLEQEIRATALRMERFVWKQVQKVQENIQEWIALQDPHCRIALLPGASLEIPEVPGSLSLMLEEDWKPVLSIYKNAKSFYEKGGSARMREAVMKQLERPVQKYLEQMREQLGRYYGEWMRQLVDQVKQSALQDVDAYFNGLIEALKDQGQLAVWRERHEQLLAAMDASSVGKDAISLT